MNVVDRIVKQVPRERIDGERGSVAPTAGSRPCACGHRVEAIREDCARRLKVPPDLGRILLVVSVRCRRLVLVPILEQGIVLFDHEHEAPVEEPEHVADVTGVLEC